MSRVFEALTKAAEAKRRQFEQFVEVSTVTVGTRVEGEASITDGHAKANL